MVEAWASLTSRGKARPDSEQSMVCVWWDWKGIVHYKLLPSGKTIYSDLYCQQLMRLRKSFDKKRTRADE